MGTIIARKRKDGSVGYHAQIVIKREGKIAHRKTQTFDRKQAAFAWLENRERSLALPGAIDALKSDDPTLGDAIDRYVNESEREIGKTKAQVLRAIKNFSIAEMKCSRIRSTDIVAFAREKFATGVKPQTISNYLSHLSAIFTVAKPAWGYLLDKSEMEAAMVVVGKLGLSQKGVSRTRRPSLDELDKILSHFGEVKHRRPSSLPMQKIAMFALFSTRRQDEIVRITWGDLDEDGSRVMVRDMKNPGQKIGNHVWCDLPPPALRIIQSMPRSKDRIFPYTTDAICAAWVRACAFLAIEDLHFHDLRHEGVSRLFEMGLNIPHVAAVSGHRSWHSLKRYTHLRQTGDKYAGWKWLSAI